MNTSLGAFTVKRNLCFLEASWIIWKQIILTRALLTLLVQRKAQRQRWRRSRIFLRLFLQTQSKHTFSLLETVSSPSTIDLPTVSVLSVSPRFRLWRVSKSRGDPLLVLAISRKRHLWIERLSMWSLSELESSVWRLQDNCCSDQISQLPWSMQRRHVTVPPAPVRYSSVFRFRFYVLLDAIISACFRLEAPQGHLT